MNHVPGYWCNCRDGFMGKHCEVNIDECNARQWQQVASENYLYYSGNNYQPPLQLAIASNHLFLSFLFVVFLSVNFIKKFT